MNVSNSFRLDGKTALVTGARRGIGRAMANALAEAGADIIAVSANLEASGSDIENDIAALGRRVSAAIAATFPAATTCIVLSSRSRADHPAIDILVNNAGTVSARASRAPPRRVLGHESSRRISTRNLCSAGSSAKACWSAAAARSSSPLRS